MQRWKTDQGRDAKLQRALSVLRTEIVEAGFTPEFEISHKGAINLRDQHGYIVTLDWSMKSEKWIVFSDMGHGRHEFSLLSEAVEACGYGYMLHVKRHDNESELE